MATKRKKIDKPITPRVKKESSMPKSVGTLLSAGSSLLQRSFPTTVVLSTLFKAKPAGAGSDIIPKGKKIKSDPNSIPFKKMSGKKYKAFMLRKQKEIARKQKRRVEKRLAAGEKNKRSLHYKEAVTAHKQLTRAHRRSVGIKWD